jgi:hypothetical protein
VSLEVDEDDILPTESSDVQVIHFLGQHFPHVVLLPFHAQRAQDGEMMDGLSTLRKIEKSLPRYVKIPIVMPVSNMGLAAVNLMLTRKPKLSDARILLIREVDLPEMKTVPLLRDHIARFNVTS